MTWMKANMSGATIVSRGVLFLFIWWILTDSTAASWWIGVPAVLLALGASIALIPPAPFIWFELFKFAPVFLLHSLLGGVDVAWRVFYPSMPIAPDLIEYPLRLSPGPSQVFMANIVSLLPGTLCAELERSVLKVHVLDREKDFLTELEMVEQRVARMFGESLRVFEKAT